MKKNQLLPVALLAMGLSIAGQSLAAESSLAGYYIGIDGTDTFTSGTYNGLANPNAGNLTLLLNHGNHYHGIGAYAYSGPAGSPTTNDTNTNNRIPEISSLDAPLALNWGSGSLYSGKLTSQNNPSEDYGNLTFARVDDLAGHETGSEQQILFNSSNNRWSTLLGDTAIGLQLISATAGLFVGDQQTANLFAISDTINLDSYLTTGFSPIFWTASDAVAGTYTAEFRLVGLNDANINSGRFYFDFAPTAVPLPAAFWFFASGLFGYIGLSRKRGLPTA
ncbi:all3515 family Zur-repressed PEP-CTERM protein [Methylomonas sp. HYX-M1]|uniref:all3515 family Zur-repressed PEP-CTERM protein n=1 Tax=Methylomonas sp. HYX-M1 TaxID=3139307 RepID=UPI00345C5415